MTPLFWKLVAANLLALNLCQLWGWLWIPYCAVLVGQVILILVIDGG